MPCARSPDVVMTPVLLAITVLPLPPPPPVPPTPTASETETGTLGAPDDTDLAAASPPLPPPPPPLCAKTPRERTPEVVTEPAFVTLTMPPLPPPPLEPPTDTEICTTGDRPDSSGERRV